jgi:hypothetical protein
MRWTRQRRRAKETAGRVLMARERRSGAQTNGAKSALVKASVGVHYPPMPSAKTGCVRRRRVVLASVADVKLAEVKSAQPGFDQP